MDRRRGQARRRQREQAVAPPDESLFESTIENDERRATIERALRTLPNEQKEVVIMKIWGQLTFQGIGEALSHAGNTPGWPRNREADAEQNDAHMRQR